MNQRLQGWKLALALLIPAAIIGAAGFVAYGALSDDDQGVATGDDDAAAVSTPAATTPPETNPVDSTAVPGASAVAVPTALTVPTVVATAVPVATATPAATAVPTAPTSAPQPTRTPGPAPTATPDPSVVTVSCSGTLPGSIATGATFGPLSAVTVPADAAASYQFVWNLGNSRTVSSPATGTISYTAPGSYAISVVGTNTTTGTTISAQCGTVTVTDPVATLAVKCSVSSVNTAINVKDAKAGDTMRVTVSWTPADIPLYLQYEFETNDPLIIVNPATSGDSQTNAFTTDGGTFAIFWRYTKTGDSGRLICPAYPGGGTGTTPTPTATATSTGATPTPTATGTGATPTPTATTDVTPTPTATTTDATPTPTPTT